MKSTPAELAKAKRRYNRNPQAANVARAERRRQKVAALKSEIFALLGNGCATCGEVDPDLLLPSREDGSSPHAQRADVEKIYTTLLERLRAEGVTGYCLYCANCRLKRQKQVRQAAKTKGETGGTDTRGRGGGI